MVYLRLAREPTNSPLRTSLLPPRWRRTESSGCLSGYVTGQDFWLPAPRFLFFYFYKIQFFYTRVHVFVVHTYVVYIFKSSIFIYIYDNGSPHRRVCSLPIDILGARATLWRTEIDVSRFKNILYRVGKETRNIAAASDAIRFSHARVELHSCITNVRSARILRASWVATCPWPQRRRSSGGSKRIF